MQEHTPSRMEVTLQDKIRCSMRRNIEDGILKRMAHRAKDVKINRAQCFFLLTNFTEGVTVSFELVSEVLQLLADDHDNPSPYCCAESNIVVTNDEASTSSQIRAGVSDERKRIIHDLAVYSLADMERCMVRGEIFQLNCVRDGQFWQTAMRTYTPKDGRTELFFVLQEFAWSLDLVLLAFTALKELLLTGQDILQEDLVGYEWCEVKRRLILKQVGDINLLSTGDCHASVRCRSASLVDKGELLEKLREIEICNDVWWPSAIQENRRRIASFLRRKFEGQEPRVDYLPPTFQIEYQDIVVEAHISSQVMVAELHGERVAAKYFTNPVVRDQNHVKEVALLVCNQHPYVVGMIGYAAGERERSGAIVMELMQKNLRELIDDIMNPDDVEEQPIPTFYQNTTPFTLDVSLHLLLQIVESLCHLKGQRVIHRDVKAMNVLVTPNGDAELMLETLSLQPSPRERFYDVKLADFGTSNSNELDSQFRTKAGTSCWMAIEVIEAESNNNEQSGGYTWSADVYSLGITAHEILTGRLPFQNLSKSDLIQVLRKGGKPPLPLDCPTRLRELLQDCLATNPNERPDIFKIREGLWRCRVEMLLHHGDKLPIRSTMNRTTSVISKREGAVGNIFRHAWPLKGFRDLFRCLMRMAALLPMDRRHWKCNTNDDIVTALKAAGVISFTYKEIEDITNKFNTNNEVGEWNYGKFYKARLNDGQLVAIKHSQIEGSLEAPHEFFNEIQVLSRLKHRNLHKLVGYCNSHNVQMLVYEYMPGGRLRDRLTLLSEKALDFTTRLGIALGCANAILYLHTENPPILNSDINSRNIFLDVQPYGPPKLAIKTMWEQAPVLNLFSVQGRIPPPCYRAPEYLLTMRETFKSNVYSFGVVLLELLTARQPTSMDKHIVREVREAGKDLNFVDQRMGPCPKLPLIQLVNLALACVQNSPEDRPHMVDVVKELRKIQWNVKYHSLLQPECVALDDQMHIRNLRTAPQIEMCNKGVVYTIDHELVPRKMPYSAVRVHGLHFMVRVLKKLIYKVVGSLTRCKPNVDQEE